MRWLQAIHLEPSDVNARLERIEKLGKTYDAKAVRALEPFLSDPIPQIREAVARVLKFPTRELRPRIFVTARRSRSPGPGSCGSACG